MGQFVVGQGNRIAHTSAEMVVSRPGRITPLLVYGPTSCGKTHLLEAVVAATRKKYPRARTLLISAEQFTSHFLEALRGGGMPSFRNKHRGLELLAIDDLQFLAGKRATLVEMIHTINSLHEEGRQIILSADRGPGELSDLGEDLLTRLHGGISCRMDLPEYETRLSIVRQWAMHCTCEIPEEVCQFVASRITADARQLQGALHRLEATSQAMSAPVNVAMAEQALGELILRSQPVVRLEDIEKAVCRALGVESRALHSGARARTASHPRMLAMWLARKHTRAGLSEISRFFGRRSHTTVLSAQTRIDRWIADAAQLELPAGMLRVEDAVRRVEENLRVG
jgi:chromosomal replication initiator protein